MGLCVDCGIEVSKRSKRCCTCYWKTRKGVPIPEHVKELLRTSKLGNKNPMWKGDNVGYFAVHEWVNKYKERPKLCVCCNLSPPHDLANISGLYKRDLSDWEYLCRRCHMTKDGRIATNKHAAKQRLKNEKESKMPQVQDRNHLQRQQSL